jgi:predicted DNA-binding transcriptional regulator AlpA
MSALPITAGRGPDSSAAPCESCAGLAERVAALEKQIATLTVRPSVLKIADLEARVGKDRSTIYRLICAGRFPQPRYYGSIRVWDRASVEAWETAQLATPHVRRARGIAACKAVARKAGGRS